MSKFSQNELDEINKTLSSPQDCLKWAFENFHQKIAKASSFGAEDAAIIDMMVKINPNSRFFTLDTGRLPQETYDIMDIVRKKYDIKLEVLFPDSSEVEDMVQKHGMNLFYDSIENRRLCCGIRKVHPMNKFLKNLDAWVTGLRGDQTKNREDAKMLEIDHQHGDIVKVNPIINWTWNDVQNYIKENDLPYNKLLDQNYPSIGCEPCTRAIKPGDDIRSGRWWWEKDSDRECGLHQDHGV